jgi:LDH2 family malate/lactate/ureidoglycolate dehydrogenase
MNKPPEAFVRVREDRLLAFAKGCFQAAGLEEAHAGLISRLLVNSDLRGVRSHGTNTVNGYCGAFEKGSANPRPNVRVLGETPTAVIVDGDGSLGYWPTSRATEGAIEKAREVGIGMGIVRHIGHYGSAGHYARMCTDAGCIGFSVSAYQDQGNASGQKTPPQVGYFGNPPICFAFPGGKEPPVVMDAATRILADYQTGPEFDALLSMIPAAFFKSMGYTAVATLMGGALAGIGLPSASEVQSKWPVATQAAMVLAIHVDTVVPKEVFLAESDRLVRDVRETYEPMPGTNRALLPGAIEEEQMALHREEGIRYGEQEQENARRVSERLDVPLPWDDG